ASDPPNRLREAARSLVSFEQGDLITDSPPSGQSFILCRNVMIYMDRTIREQLLHRFHEALVPGGFLMLGRVETLLGPSRRLFRPVSIRERVYKKSE